jgi:tetratricopeptide (TPR) repeat protein
MIRRTLALTLPPIFSSFERIVDTWALAMKPDNHDAYYHMGCAYAELKQWKEAIAAYKKCIALEPKGHDAYWAAEIIRDIEENRQ